jgi:hypothetical protein
MQSNSIEITRTLNLPQWDDKAYSLWESEHQQNNSSYSRNSSQRNAEIITSQDSLPFMPTIDIEFIQIFTKIKIIGVRFWNKNSSPKMIDQSCHYIVVA